MAELIVGKADGTLDFGDFTLDVKTKKEDYEFEGDLYKVKTFNEITKLERNGLFVYESVPGSRVSNLKCTENGVKFTVEAKEDLSITLELEPSVPYSISIDGKEVGTMTTNLGGKLSMSVEINDAPVAISINKA